MSEQNKVYSDVLVIGSGFAGLRAASAAVRKGVTVTVIEKGPRATPDILGFNVAVGKNDSKSDYEEDLKKSAAGISNEMLEKILVNNAAGEVEFLESIGFAFDKKTNGEYDTLHPLGCKHPRLIHYKANSGIEASRMMREDCQTRSVSFFGNIFIHSLIKNTGRIIGAVGIDIETGALSVFIAKAVVLATGGCGSVYDSTTYPRGLNGDGVAMVYEAGGKVIDMEFQQFEPCAFIYPEGLKGKVIPTTLLRKGAQLYNCNKEDFMPKYGLDRDSVQKFDLSHAMVNEVKAGFGSPHGGVYYDVSMMPEKMVVEDHAIFYDPAKLLGVDLLKEPAEVLPAAHTSLGGVKINERCETSLPGLFAAGEVAGGFYGANRIGGSAGIETLVFGHVAGDAAADSALSETMPEGPATDLLEVCGLSMAKLSSTGGCSKAVLTEKINELQKMMSLKVGIQRNEEDLKSAEAELEKLEKQVKPITAEGFEEIILKKQFENMVDISRMMILSSIIRKESRGVFFREDFPERSDSEWIGNITVTKAGDAMDIGFIPKSVKAGI